VIKTRDLSMKIQEQTLKKKVLFITLCYCMQMQVSPTIAEQVSYLKCVAIEYLVKLSVSN